MLGNNCDDGFHVYGQSHASRPFLWFSAHLSGIGILRGAPYERFCVRYFVPMGTCVSFAHRFLCDYVCDTERFKSRV